MKEIENVDILINFWNVIDFRNKHGRQLAYEIYTTPAINWPSTLTKSQDPLHFLITFVYCSTFSHSLSKRRFIFNIFILSLFICYFLRCFSTVTAMLCRSVIGRDRSKISFSFRFKNVEKWCSVKTEGKAENWSLFFFSFSEGELGRFSQCMHGIVTFICIWKKSLYV